MKRAAVAVVLARGLAACASPSETTPDAPGGGGDGDASVDGMPRPDAPPTGDVAPQPQG